MITLYGVYRSRATRPLWLLAEAGTAFDLVPVLQAYRLTGANAGWQGLTTAAPEFLAVNPQGQIPALTDDGLILTDSLAITLYLARRHGGMLGPQSDAELALMEQWALFAATSVEGPGLEIYFAVNDGNQNSPGGQATIAVAAEKLRRPLARLQSHLAANSHMVGDRFTAADIITAECLRYAQSHPALLAEFPAVNAWLTACQARPAFQSIWAKRQAEPA